MNIVQKNSSELSEDEREKMFSMYVLSYKMGGQPLWFEDKEKLFSRYHCFVTFDDNYLTVYAMFQFKKKFNKISLVCHDGSEEGKRLSVELRYSLVSHGGWILEASDKVSWLLRKRRAPIIMDYESIVDALDIVDNPNDTIEMNPDFDVNDKETYQYIRIYNDVDNGKIYRSEETLFGTEPCNYDSLNCNRRCNKTGGKGTRRKVSKKKSKSRKSKKSRKSRKSRRKIRN